MTKRVFSVDVVVEPEVQDCVLLELPHVVREVWLQHSVVVTGTAYPREWSACVLTFSGLG